MSHFEIHGWRIVLLAGVVSATLVVPRFATAQIPFDREPISYSSSKPHNPVEALQAQLESGKVKLRYDTEHGYLKSVLETLHVPVSSQMLVFSKTSFQLRRISPWSPRALYYNDRVYIGWVPDGDVVEVATTDPELGAVFYTLSQEETGQPKFIRDQGNCLTCHASSRTHGVPGLFVRSVYASSNGQPHYGAGTFRTNHESPLKERWGGWYVTGTHGRQRHMGNVIAEDKQHPDTLDVEAGANLTDISKLTRTTRYLAPHSDIVALLVLEHQTDMQNLITLANYETRIALYQQATMNRVLEQPADFVSESTQRRIASASEKLLKYLLFVDEVELTDKIKGTSDFATEFAALGPKDQQGRSLRDFDLQRRLFRYPCSYLIYSEEFRALPSQVKSQIYRKLWEILTGKDQGQDFARLTRADRRAIYEILLATNTDLPSYWQDAEKVPPQN